MRRTERFSRVLVSVGRRPNSRGIGLENTKVKIDERGFVASTSSCGRPTRTSWRSATWRASRCSAHKATHEGTRRRRSACTASRRRSSRWRFRPSSSPIPEIAWAGLTEEQAKARSADVEVARYPWAASGERAVARPHRGTDEDPCRSGDRSHAGRRHCRAGRGRTDLRKACWRSRWAARPATWPSRSIRIRRSARRSAFASEAYFGTATEIYRPRRDQESAGTALASGFGRVENRGPARRLPVRPKLTCRWRRCTIRD